jgi:hypothetical protein
MLLKIGQILSYRAPIFSSKFLSRSRYIVLIFTCLLFTTCGEPVPAEYKWFFDLSISEQHRRFQTLPVEQQIDIYFVAMGIHPPDTVFASDIAQGGVNALPTLIRRFESEDEFRRLQLLYVFERMAERGHLSGRREIIEMLRHAVSEMRFPQFREIGQERLAAIEHYTRE